MTTASAPSPRRRLIWRALAQAALYILSVALISGWLGWEPPRSGPVIYLLAVLPSLVIGWTVWDMLRAIETARDEFLRMIEAQTAIGALGLTLFITNAWGFLGEYAGVWVLPLYLVFPLYCLCLAIVKPLVWRRYR